jgi:hypothetical protein
MAFFSLNFRSFLPVIGAFSLHVQAVQPMTESDLEIVSATTGDNILNIFGASEAGLRVDSGSRVEPGSARLNENSSLTLKKEQYEHGESAEDLASLELRQIEDKRQVEKNLDTPATLSQETQNFVIFSSESTTKASSAYDTSSEINYKTARFKHQMREIDNGGIAVERDLQIDLLKLENLKGAHYDGRSAGSIYLSDWSSRGDTRIISEQR